MTTFTFRIPDRIEELEDEENFEQYYLVRKKFSSREIEFQLSEVEDKYRQAGPDVIVEYFDVFYHVIKHFSELAQPVRDKAWTLLSKALTRFQAQLSTFFENFQLDQRLDWQNKLQMFVYLFLAISDFYEDDDVSTSTELNPFSEGSGRGKKKKSTYKSQMYQSHKFQTTNTILKIFTLHLDRLFDPPYFLNSFVNIVTKYIYKILENSNSLKSNPNNSAIFQNVCDIIGAALDKYNHSVNYCMKIIELLQAKETLVGPCSQLVSRNIKNGHAIFISDILQQIKAIDIQILSRDNSAPKAISSFLIELARNCPEKMFQNLSFLVDFLEHESYTLRNAVLEIICNIVLQMFVCPTKNRDVQIKDKLLDYLFDHIHDLNSYTRSKVLQLWSKLAESQVIPMTRLNSITSRIVGRLEDRSCFVRKNAVHFLTQTIKDNPFMILRKKELIGFKLIYEKVYEKHKEKLQIIQDQQLKTLNEMIQLSGGDKEPGAADESNSSVDSNKENEEEATATTSKDKRKGDDIVEVIANKRQKMIEEIQSLANDWFQLENDFCAFWSKKGSSLELAESIPEDIPQENLDSAFEFFRSLVKDKEFEQALRVLTALKDMYPNEEIFEYRKRQNNGNNGENAGNVDEGIGVDDDEDSNAQPMDTLFDVNDHLFLSSILNFNNEFNRKLPYIIDLARLVFLAPLINFGKTAIEPDQFDSKNPNSLRDMLQQQSAELETNQSSIDRLEAILASFGQVFFRFKEAEVFIDMLSESVPKICHLLQSKNIADVQEAINFFTFAFKLDLSNSIIGVQKMLRLIFTKEKAIKERLLEAFVEIYLNETEVVPEDQEVEEEEEELPNAKNIVFMEIRNFSHMILRLNQGELVCAEALVQELYKSNRFSQMHLQVLWERYAMKLSRTSEEEARAALIIIGMLASAQPNLIQNENHLNCLIKISLGERCNDYRLIADTCEVLIRGYKLPTTETLGLFYKLPHDHQLFERLQIILLDSITVTENPYWYRMSTGIIKVIYYFAEKPDSIITRIVEYTYKKIINLAKGNTEADTANHLDGTEFSALSSQRTTCEFPNSQATTVSSQATNQDNYGQIDDIIVARLLSILGDVAITCLIHLDFHLMREIKIRQFIEEQETQKIKDNKAKEKQKTKDKRKTKRMSILPDDNEEEDDIIGPSTEDPYTEMVQKTCSEHILYGQNSILGKFIPLIESIAEDFEGKKYSLRVRLAGCLAMFKFMALSQKYAQQARDKAILMKLLDSSMDWEIRSNAVISFGDLLVRYPNYFEGYSRTIFDCLNDANFTVKSNALKVLTRLILADMVKPKGNISKIARLITDADVTIKESAQLFFIEMAKKVQTNIYNYLPDIISNLSGENGMLENKFHEMIKFLFERLEKTKNTESLVTKLCNRFKETHEERSWRDLSFCLSQLQYNDRAIINLMNNFGSFADVLCYDAINDNIMIIINTIRKASNVKPETKILLDELENKMKEIRSKGIEHLQQAAQVEGAEAGVEGDGANNQEMATDENQPSEKTPPSTPEVEQPVRSTRRGRPTRASTSVQQKQTSRPARGTRSKAPPAKTTRGRRKVVIEEDSDNDDGDDTYNFDDDDD